MKILPVTKELISDAEYFSSASEFFGGFGQAFDLSRSQILKVETRQTYQEPDSESYRAMANGNWQEAMAALDASRSEDIELYADLKTRGVEFARCRPIAFPMSDYMRWEMEVYKFNAKHGERIFCCNYDSVAELFKDNIVHDFMVFDARIAFVHNYNNDGLIEGGWKITSLDKIIKLQTLFIFLKSQCRPFELFSE